MAYMIEDNIRQHRKSYLFQGTVFIILGALALIVPAVAAEFFALLIGIFLVVTGIAQALVGYDRNRHYVILISSLASIIAGVLLLVWPNAGIMVMSTIICIFLFAEAAFELFTALVYMPFSGWVWMLLSGLVTLALAIIIVAGWPITGAWLLGVLIGINFLFFGMSTLMIVNSVK